MTADNGRYRSHVGVDRSDGHVELVVATKDAVAGFGGVPAIRVLRMKPGRPNSPDVADEQLDLLAVTVEVRRDVDGEMGWPPADFGQGEGILLNRDQAVDVRAVLDEFITGARSYTMSEKAELERLAADDARGQEIAEMIRAAGDPWAWGRK